MIGEKTTPMMEQWKSCKSRAKDMLLFFRMGDFYEAFYEDAQLMSEELELTLTKRQGIPMSGVPWQTIETYINRLVARGHKVAIAEQVEDPKETKGLVRREIVRVVTPGTAVTALPDKASNYIASVSRVGSLFGLSLLEVTTGEFKVAEFETAKEMVDELFRVQATEVVMTKKFKGKHHDLFDKELITFVEEWQFEHQNASRYLTEHFALSNLDGFGLKGMVAAINSAGALLSYVHEELSMCVDHISRIVPYTTSESLALDRTCLRNLELMEEVLPILDKTVTPMGGRLLSQWLKKPLLSVEKITKRQDAIERIYHDRHSGLREKLKGVRDLERLMMKISASMGSPKDFVALGLSLKAIPPVRELLETYDTEALVLAKTMLVDVSKPASLIERALVEEPPIRLSDGKVFKDGYNEEIDELRELTTNAKGWLARYQTEVKGETGIKNLKVSFNKVFGYYIEVARGQAHLMPDSFQRRQTLVNSERFISPELKEYEEKVLSAEGKIQAIEAELFKELRETILKYRDTVFQIAKAIAFVDVIAGLAEVANKQFYSRPIVDESDNLEIIEGRHPAVEALLGEKFIPNETELGGNKGRLMLITGPNMAGKSTYIRQVALIVILAQMGSFVPAKKAHIGVIDKIFTRIGASDDLSRGQSTFMVEMSETANILNNVTDKSLVILDEIGRGTSTYDGLSIAWAVVEYLLIKEKKKGKTLFATHYGELTEIERSFPEAVNYHAAVDESEGEILFLHKIKKGSANRSYGIHVAKLAGLPLDVICRSSEILEKLEAKRAKKNEHSSEQLSLF
ncbi:MAG: DNA mismatch repair protein MutS [Chlamydiales bacterium]|nr:DNA mismatch repair protein MutS [Chlamydiales bacterium]MCH9619908.1 DNA mismatch repair protein MutS [Chlamydiales bacterium]MCH9622665.1 DNA mismatch repair protein MutS [Chlamydiales bacterium]